MVLSKLYVMLLGVKLNQTSGFQYFQAAIGKDIIDVTLIARRCTRRIGTQSSLTFLQVFYFGSFLGGCMVNLPHSIIILMRENLLIGMFFLFSFFVRIDWVGMDINIGQIGYKKSMMTVLLIEQVIINPIFFFISRVL